MRPLPVSPVEKNDGITKYMVVQLSPQAYDPAFACCFMVVEDPKPWGATGYVHVIGDRAGPGGLAYYAAKWPEMSYIGMAAWVTNNDTE